MFSVKKTCSLTIILLLQSAHPLAGMQDFKQTIKKTYDKVTPYITLKNILLSMATLGIGASFIPSSDVAANIDSVPYRLGSGICTGALAFGAERLITKYVFPTIKHAITNPLGKDETNPQNTKERTTQRSLIRLGTIAIGTPTLILLTAIAVRNSFMAGLLGGTLLRTGSIIACDAMKA